MKYNYKEDGKKITNRVITPLADKIGCYNDLMGIGENTNKSSSKYQQAIGEKAKDIYNKINNNKNSKNHFQGGYTPYRDPNYENIDWSKYYAYSKVGCL